MGLDVKCLTQFLLVMVATAMVGCGGDPTPPAPLDPVEQAAVGEYTLDMATHVPRDPAPYESMRLVLREDRSFAWTCWSDVAETDITATGTWHIQDGRLIRVSTGYFAANNPDLPAMDVREPRTDTWAHEDGGFRIWPHRPYMLRRVE